MTLALVFSSVFAIPTCTRAILQTITEMEKSGSQAPRKLFELLSGRSEGSRKMNCSVMELYRALLAIDRTDVAELLDDLIPEKPLKSMKSRL